MNVLSPQASALSAYDIIIIKEARSSRHQQSVGIVKPCSSVGSLTSLLLFMYKMRPLHLNKLKLVLLILFLSTFVFVLNLNLFTFSSASFHDGILSKTDVPSSSKNFLRDKVKSAAPRVVRFSKAKRYVQRPWAHIAECANFTTRRTLKHSLTPVALASYPGSGNTWLRSLIELASGIYTGSLYKDAALYLQGFWGETADWGSGVTCVQKTHDSGKEHIGTFSGGKGILLCRNPYEAILSFHNFLYGGHTGFAPSKNFDRKEWPDFFLDQTRRWLGMAVNWTQYANELLIVHYEDVKKDPLQELRRILEFLELPIDEARLTCIQKYPQAKFQRKKGRSREQWSTEKAFPEQIRSTVDRAIRYVDYLSRRSGQPPVPFERYNFYEHSVRPTETSEAGDQSWYEWVSHQWGSRVVKSFIEDPLTVAMRQEAASGGFYAWRIPFELGYNETSALERDFNSGPLPTIIGYRRLDRKVSRSPVFGGTR